MKEPQIEIKKSLIAVVSLEDVLFTLANQIERQRRGSGLHWIFFPPLPFRRSGRAGETVRHHPGEKRKSETSLLDFCK